MFHVWLACLDRAANNICFTHLCQGSSSEDAAVENMLLSGERAVYQKYAFDIRKSLSVDCINVSHYDGATINCQQLHYCYYSCDPRNFATMTFFSG